MRCAPPPDADESSFHEVWWDSSKSEADKGRPQAQLHKVFEWLGDSWAIPGWAESMTPEWVYEEGWRYVRPIKLLDDKMRMDGTPPDLNEQQARTEK